MSNIALSKTTIEILKNFSTINTSIVIKEGNVLRTISNEENILATAKVEETFPQTFAIYDLNQFLAGLSLFENPSLVFDNVDYLIIKSGRSRVKYYFSDPEITLKTADHVATTREPQLDGSPWEPEGRCGRHGRPTPRWFRGPPHPPRRHVSYWGTVPHAPPPKAMRQ